MASRTFKIFLIVILLLPTMGLITAFGQLGGAYPNSWINYAQPYVKISISATGLHRLPVTSLPAGFPKDDPDKFQIFHRGKEIAILSANKEEILFYAVPNDGASDSLLYRPMSSRINKYSGLFSDLGAYFLTVGTAKGMRAKVVKSSNDNQDLEPYHLESLLQTYTSSYSQSAEELFLPEFINSFFELGASKTGPVMAKDSIVNFPFQLTDYKKGIFKPKVKMLLHGRSAISRTLEVFIGKSVSNLRKAGTVNLDGFSGKIIEYDLEDTDILENGSGVIRVKSTSTVFAERFSIAFYNINYAQDFKMQGRDVKLFTLAATDNSQSRVKIQGVKDNSYIYDITDLDQVRIVNGGLSDFTIDRVKGKSLSLVVTSEVNTLDVSKVVAVSFQNIDPKLYNYIIVTADLLAPVLNKYADYRQSPEGGSYRPIIVRIKDIYNQFNYGEVSPVAIRRFVDYMISDGNKDKSLFLVGKTISSIPVMTKNLEGDVPTVGYPGSDILLVEGLGGAPQDVPAIPVGRLMATTAQNVEDYLKKVTDYEKNSSGSFGWRKKVLHLNGGHATGEIQQFRGALSDLTSLVEEGSYGGQIKAFVKQSNIEVEQVDISSAINDGVGMFTFFGHGSRAKTDLDFGYISDPVRGYQNKFKYPLMYFNGCGVGNIFRGGYSTTLGTSSTRPLSVDWILTPDKGAIAVIANSFSSYVSPTVRYLDALYATLFSDPKAVKLSIGQVQMEVARKIKSTSTNLYDVANIHQSILQGDPAVHLILVELPDYALDPDDGILICSESPDKTIGNSDKLRAAIIMSNWGKYIKDEKIPLQIKYWFNDGTSETVNSGVASIPYQDTLFVSFPNRKNIQQIDVRLDPGNTLAELSKANNFSELSVDWTLAKVQKIYPIEKVKDIVAPLLNVTFNRRVLKNDDVVAPDPVIRISLEDDRLLLGDSTLLDVFLKPCGSDTCDFKRISYLSSQLKLDLVSGTSVQLQYSPVGLKSGTYELLVNSRDRSDNTASQAYRISFRVRGGESKTSVICSPNPASNYVHFQTSGYAAKSLSAINWMIYDTRGILIEEHEILTNQEAEAKDWYWIPKSTSGVYLYKVFFRYADDVEENITGRIIILK